MIRSGPQPGGRISRPRPGGGAGSGSTASTLLRRAAGVSVDVVEFSVFTLKPRLPPADMCSEGAFCPPGQKGSSP